jgi:hypothetical protein
MCCFGAGVIRETNGAIALWHEFGHATGIFRGMRMNPDTHQLAYQYENAMRAHWYKIPIGPRNAPRTGGGL